MSDKTPTIFQGSITTGNSPVTLSLQDTQGHPIRGLTVVNTGATSFTVNTSVTGAAYGDDLTLEGGDIYNISVPTSEPNGATIDKILLTRISSDATYKVIASAAFVDYQKGATEDVEDSVQQYGAVSSATDKINYTVTTGKNLFIQQWHVGVSEGKGNIFELQDDGASLASLATGEDGGAGGTMKFPINNPVGPIAAGSTVRIHRDTGDAGKDWSGGFIGYEVDE